MSRQAPATPGSDRPGRRGWAARHFERVAVVFTRIALAAAFLSGIASRFGLWGRDVGYGNFDAFVAYTAEVNAFMPEAVIPFLAWSATIAELVLGVALVFGVALRWTALASAVLLAAFGTAMALSMGIKSPLDYSVFSAAGAALLLAIYHASPGRSPRSLPPAGGRGDPDPFS